MTTKIGQEFILITHETITDKDERTIIQTPLYFWSMPQIVKEYLSMITWKKKMN
ncbi:NAD(P)H-dependent oxidoreductase [Streptococcus suis]|nr:NAD(P)H-dependent oxidoreductase [Streptococcus suis]HEL2030411.1 NAD(P)H-dependent oxidoreductase [Streptococcus suis]HEL2031030.1 NAD(P)H-dependent oxidoreductase [Streptococcus suis]